MTESDDLWFPLFEWTKFLYRSFLVLPSDTDPEGPVVLKEWAKGEFICGQALDDGDGYTLSGQLIFRPGVELAVNIRGRKGRGTGPGTFEGTGTGTSGVTMGAVYELTGLLYPQLQSGAPVAARIGNVRGWVKAVQGPATNPNIELGGLPVGTVGAFVIVSLGASE
jgi:hypothetical protein